MLSGQFAAEAAIEALNSGDFSSATLSVYEKKLRASSFLKDMKSYKNVVGIIHENSGSFLKYYPEKINEFFAMFTQSGYVPRKSQYRRFIKNFIKDRKISQFFKDIFNFIKMGIEIIK